MTGKVLGQIPGDSEVTVLEGPQCADNLAWWKVDSPALGTGWMAEGSGSDYYLEPTTTPITEFTGADANVKFKNVSFTYNGVFGKKVQAVSVFAVTVDPNSGTPLLSAPEYTEFTFQDGTTTDIYQQPTIQVYPVADFEKVNQEAPKRIASLKALLQKKSTKPSGEIPVLPVVMAAQVFDSNIAYMDFDGGSGVRFLTMYAQGIMPITSEDLRYIFQGLTTDGKYLISVTFPLSASVLADKQENDAAFNAIDMSGQSAGDQYQKYLQDTVTKLNGADSTVFTPNLGDLDVLIQALSVK